MVHFVVRKEGQQEPEWSSDYSFLIPLSGTAGLLLKKEILELKKGDIVMVQPFQYFSLSDVSGSCLLCRVDLTKLMSGQGTAPGRLECNSAMELHKERYLEVIYDILHLVQEIRQQENVCAHVREMKWSYQLLEHLLRDFRVETEPEGTEFPMMQNMLFYISQHYTEALTLGELAEQFYVSSSYVSKMFRVKLGTSFLKYINEIRLLHAAGQLRDTKKTIDQIAEESGFKNARSFSTKFREYYQILPSEYRRQQKTEAPAQLQADEAQELAAFLAELEQERTGTEPVRHPGKKQLITGVDLEQAVSLNRPGGILTIRKASYLLLHPVREVVRELAEKLHFTGIYFHELFHDDMEIYVENRDGTPRYSFYRMDQLFDFIVECGMTPFVELSFVPFLMVENVNKEAMMRNSISDMPTDMEQWDLLVSHVVEHMVERYGRSQVLKWKFCVWNSPDNPGINYSALQRENYYRLYWSTWQVIKAIDERFQVGTSALMSVNLLYPEWMDSFASFYQKEHCEPDFVMTNLYTVDDTPESIQRRQLAGIMQRRDAVYDVIRRILKNNESCGWKVNAWHVAEWNFDLGWNNALQDTMFYPAYIVKNMVDCWQTGIDFGVMDPLESLSEDQMIQGSFQGKRGIFTYDFIKKPSYYVYEMLTKLGSRFVQKGENYLITESEDGEIQILLYDYLHLSEAYCQRKMDRNVICPEMLEPEHDLTYEIRLEHAAARTYLKTTSVLNENYGNPYAFCRNYKKASRISSSDISYINQMNQPLRMTDYVNRQEDGSICLYEHLEPFEVRLIRLSVM